ncbi:MAG: DUF2905 domain-containing protein [Candidatus Brocadiaceae bacterium]|nr:DUF2905 domain-containing protein [Candidatus Brocadiaceae bacterium]
MGEINGFGKTLIFLGIIMIVFGIFFMIGNKIPFLGKLPGDISVQKKNFNFYFPITTCIIISVILTIIMKFIGKK